MYTEHSQMLSGISYRVPGITLRIDADTQLIMEIERIMDMQDDLGVEGKVEGVVEVQEFFDVSDG